MEFQYSLPRGYEMKDLVALNKMTVKAFRKWGMTVFRTILCVLGAALIFSGIATALADDFTSEYMLVAVVPVILGTLWLLLGAGAFWISAWSSRHLFGQKPAAYTLRLSAECITEKNPKGIRKYYYNTFVDVIRYQTAWYFFLDQKRAIILPDRCLVEGDVSQLEQSIEEWYGKPVRNIK